MALNTPLDILTAIAPDLAAESDVEDFICLAELQTNSCFFGDKYNYAVALRTAHIMTLSKARASGESGAISSKTEGDLSISYSTPAQSSGTGDLSDLSQTQWGVQLQGLIRGAGPILGVTGANALQGGCCD